MSDPVRVATVEDVKPGEALRISRDSAGTHDDVVLVRTTEGTFYALDNTCSHALASLAEGWVEDDCIECPLHAAAFSYETGEALSLPATEPVGTHAVEVRGDEVWLTPGSVKGEL
ncbi:MAG TPA: non-heme iron oxygenase ferredoxin subunit [Propionibacterium sp.]|jgi:3-phenylpropionate/trans-cinnamate dioxygenase ferredoxin subunit|nr:non-heme iron oxygenase ferredoxin subunit [Propionibacterium sp.]